MIKILIAINVAVFAGWYLAAWQNVPELMTQNFLISWEALASGRIWTLITSVFSHNSGIHIFINMFVLLNFGPIVERGVGTWRFLKFYFLAGVVASLAHAVVCKFLLGEPEQAALGASGAIAGVVLVFSFLFPKEKVFLFGILPIPAIFAALAFVAVDIWGLIAQAQGGGLPIGHGAHLGGAITGIFYFVYFLRPRRKQIQSRLRQLYRSTNGSGT